MINRKRMAVILAVSLAAASSGTFMAEEMTQEAVNAYEDDLDLDESAQIPDESGTQIQDSGSADDTGSEEVNSDSDVIEPESGTEEETAQEEKQEDVDGLIEDTGVIKTNSVPQTESPVIPGFYVDPTQYPAANITRNTSFIYYYLRDKLGLGHAAACGVLANMHLESNFRPIALGDGGTSYGICQWHLDRFSNLIYYCNSAGLDYNTLTGQLEYLNYELTHGYSGVLNYLENVPDTAEGAYQAAYVFCTYFESPDFTADRSAQRGNLASNEYFEKTFDSEEDEQIERDVQRFVLNLDSESTTISFNPGIGSLLGSYSGVFSYQEESETETETEEDLTQAQESVTEEPLSEEDSEQVQ